MKRATVILVGLWFLSACGSGDEIDPSDILGGWQLESGIVDGQPLALVGSHPVTIELAEDRYGGTAACNSYGGAYFISGSSVDFGLADITEMACEPAGVMELERSYIETLFEIDEILVEDGLLKLTGPGSELVFSALAPPATAELLGTVWVLDGLIEGESVASASGDRATLEFFSDGSFIASTGCRSLTGTYRQTATGIVSANMTAGGECTAELVQQDSHVVTVLEGSYQIAIEGDLLTLTIPGDEGLVYRAES